MVKNPKDNIFNKAKLYDIYFEIALRQPLSPSDRLFQHIEVMDFLDGIARQYYEFGYIHGIETQLNEKQ